MVEIIIIALAMIAIWILLRFVHKLYPNEPVRVGDMIDIYMDGHHDRTAYVSGVEPGYIVIYDKLHLPVSFRGRFYSVGYMEDGYALMFISRRRLFFLATIAELIRRIAGTPEYKEEAINSEETTDVAEDSEKEDPNE